MTNRSSHIQTGRRIVDNTPGNLDIKLISHLMKSLRARRKIEEAPASRVKHIVISSRRADEIADRHLEAFIHHPSLPHREGRNIPDAVIDRWFDGLTADAADAGISMPLATVVEETKRIVIGLRRHLPLDTDIYTLEEGKVVIEVFGAIGYGFQLICEAGGSALCLVTAKDKSRRARYDNSSELPDGFVKEGLDAVRPVG